MFFSFEFFFVKFKNQQNAVLNISHSLILSTKFCLAAFYLNPFKRNLAKFKRPSLNYFILRFGSDRLFIFKFI